MIQFFKEAWIELASIVFFLASLVVMFYMTSCTRMSQYEVEQAGLCLPPPEEHMFAFNDQPPQLIYQFACFYENTKEPNACCDYIQADNLTGIYCTHRFCTKDCHGWDYAGYDCPESLQGLIQ